MKIIRTEEVVLNSGNFWIKTVTGSWVLGAHSELYIGGPAEIEEVIKLLQTALSEPVKKSMEQVKEV